MPKGKSKPAAPRASTGCVPTITENLIEGNDTVGIRVSDSPGGLIKGNALLGNVGGIACRWTLGMEISQNTIDGNSSSGIHCFESSPDIRDNMITDNACNADGGGIYLEFNSNPKIVNNILTGNTASNNNIGINLNGSNNTLTYNTVALNSINGMRVYGSSNTIYNNNRVLYYTVDTSAYFSICYE